MPIAIRTAPGTSIRGLRSARRPFFTKSRAPMSASGATITLIRNDHRHE